MLNTYCQNVLKTELQKSDYDGKSADEAWSWLMDPVTTTATVTTNLLLTPVLAAKLLGPLKANVLAAKIKVALPDIGAALMASGVNLSDSQTQAFLDSMVDGTTFTQTDSDTLKAQGSVSRSETTPPRFTNRFHPADWPHVAQDGNTGTSDDPAINGFPNTITREEFDAAWVAAGRN